MIKTVDIGIDFGSSQTVISTPQREVLLVAPTVIAVDTESGKQIACGEEALHMIGRAPDSISVIRPIQNGAIAEYEHAEKLLRHYIRKVCEFKIVKPRAVLTIPAGVTEVEQRSMLEAAAMAGVRQAALLDRGVAAAIGAGVDIGGARGSMVVHLGAGTTDVAVMSLNGIAVSRSVRVGGDQLNQAIIRYMRSHYRMLIGELTAERIKLNLACTVLPEEEKTMTVPGRDALSGLPRTETVTSSYIMEAISEPVEAILKHVHGVLEITPPELAGDIMDGGITLTGGGALLSGMAKLLTDMLGVTCYVAEDPMLCAGIGAGVALTLLDKIPTHSFDISEYTYQLSKSVRQ